MKSAERRILSLLLVLALSPWAAVWWLFQTQASTEMILPTSVRFPTERPSLTPTRTPTVTRSATLTVTPTLTPTATLTWTPAPTITASLTLTPTLATRVIAYVAVMPGVQLAPTLTPFPTGLIWLPAPPNPIEPLPNATELAPPYDGWVSFESDHPAIHYSLPWEPRLNGYASEGQYHRSEQGQGHVQFVFEGEGLRLRYVAAQNMGLFQVVVDGVVIDTVDAYAPDLMFPGTSVYFVGKGQHTLELRSAQQHNPQSSGQVLALDAIQVYRGSATTLIIPPPRQTSTPTVQPLPAAGIELVGAPPTVQPTLTPIPPALVTVSLVIAYDENGNRAVDPAEGVSGVSVRVVEIGTNRVISQTFTDSSGFTRLQVVTSAPSQLVVPYFGRVWKIPTGRRGSNTRFTLLLTPGNQPGLIP